MHPSASEICAIRVEPNRIFGCQAARELRVRAFRIRQPTDSLSPGSLAKSAEFPRPVPARGGLGSETLRYPALPDREGIWSAVACYRFLLRPACWPSGHSPFHQPATAASKLAKAKQQQAAALQSEVAQSFDLLKLCASSSEKAADSPRRACATLLSRPPKTPWTRSQA